MLAAAVALATLAQEGMRFYLGVPETPEAMIVDVRNSRIEPAKVGPKDKLDYEYVVTGYASSPATAPGTHPIRFRVFSQVRKKENDPAVSVCRLLLRLWKFNESRLRFEHSTAYRQLVDVYLSWGGKAGGEQLFTEDREGDRVRTANVIYIYDLASFANPVEMAREVAHEYGHATLPPIGGFKQPEDWGNGYLGERLYMKWLAKDLKSGVLAPVDAMGASAREVEAWVEKNVNPHISRVAQFGPDELALSGEGWAGIDAYTGLTLWAEEILGPRVLSRSMELTGSTSAKDIPNAIAMAVSEREMTTLGIPKHWIGKDVWLPTGPDGRVKGGGIQKRKGGWSQVRVISESVIVSNKVIN